MICKVKSHNEIWLQKQKMENELYYFQFQPYAHHQGARTPVNRTYTEIWLLLLFNKVALF